MKKLLMPLMVAIIVMVSSCDMQTKKAKAVSVDDKAVALAKDFSKKFETNWNEGNAEGVALLFADNAIRVIGTSQKAIAGFESIKNSFEAEINNNGKLEGTTIAITTKTARFLTDEFLIGCGTWNIMNKENQSVMSGKWGNTFQFINGELRIFMESAYPNTLDGMDTLSKSIPIESHHAFALTAKKNYRKIEASINDFINVFNTKEFNKLSKEFTEDGIRSVSSFKDISIGRKAIEESFINETDGILNASLSGFRNIGSSYIAAYGQWNLTDIDGNLIEYGQWGNVLEVIDGRAIIVMESAGTFYYIKQ
jgi:uncharacterized protein (TIGR02246 family)